MASVQILEAMKHLALRTLIPIAAAANVRMRMAIIYNEIAAAQIMDWIRCKRTHAPAAKGAARKSINILVEAEAGVTAGGAAMDEVCAVTVDT